MAAGTVYPVNNNKFKVGIDNSESATTVIANLTNFAPSIEGGIEEWNPMEAEGWGDAMMTSKNLAFLSRVSVLMAIRVTTLLPVLRGNPVTM